MDVKQNITYDPRASFFGWLGVVCAALVTAAICWNAAAVVSMKQDIAVLLGRPEGVSRAEYMRDSARNDRDMQELRDRMPRK